MKNMQLISTVCMAIAYSQSANADTFTDTTAITEVTIYKNGGALITREGSIAVPAGQHSIIVPNLPEQINSSHIAPLAAVSNTGVEFVSLNTRKQIVSSSASEPQKALIAKIEEVQNQIDGLKNQIAALELQVNFLRTVGSRTSANSSPVSLDELKEKMQFVGSSASDIYAAIQGHKIEISSLTKEKRALERELKQIGSTREDYTQATIVIDSSEAQTIDYSISYYVSEASWSSRVTANLDSKAEQLGITLVADITQQTGENWDNVSLQLSNSRPSGYVGDVDVSSEYVSFRDEREKMRMLTMDQEGAQYAAPEMATSSFVGVEQSSFDRNFVLPEPVNIRSSTDTKHLNILKTTTPAALSVRAAPYKNRTAFAFLETTLDQIPNLRDVGVTLVRDGHHAGSGRWPNLIENQPLELPFGLDQNVEISYQELAPREGDKGFINKKNTETKRYLITVTNHHSTRMPIVVYDRYPVSTHEDIEVTPLSIATQPDDKEIENQPGVISWKKTLEPGENWEIHHEYRVTYPSNKNISYRRR